MLIILAYLASVAINRLADKARRVNGTGKRYAGTTVVCVHHLEVYLIACMHKARSNRPGITGLPSLSYYLTLADLLTDTNIDGAKMPIHGIEMVIVFDNQEIAIATRIVVGLVDIDNSTTLGSQDIYLVVV